jgi:hypothetical protein
MTPLDRARLTTTLRGHVARIAADLQAQVLRPGPARAGAERLHRDEQVGEAFDVWLELLARRAAVLWVLKSVYVRVLEDKGLLTPGRILDRESQNLFERLAPNLGDTAYLRWVYRDLASPDGGLPELFAPQPAEVAVPADALSRELLATWRHVDADSGKTSSFAGESFAGELMGDLYQELDPVVKDRFALCQTPEFVRRFMLDRTLTPAIEEYGADQVRLLDPACGSGHFLIDGLGRLVAATARQRPDWARLDLVKHCLARVVGIDLNDYACALARARLIMTAADLAGMATLAEAATFHPQVYWADGLEQVERGEDTRGQQLSMLESVPDEAPRAGLTRPEVRVVLGRVLRDRFHAVVANPPYIVERDKGCKAYHKEKVGRRARYVSAYKEYSLASPFTERSFQLAVPGGFVGLIVTNNFMKRDFGRPLIEQVLAQLDLTLVADTSQAYIPHHGTPTVLLFGRNRTGKSASVRAVMGRRGEAGIPADPAKGRVWAGIELGWNQLGFENEFVTVADVPRAKFAKHPWSLGGGGAAGLRDRLERHATTTLGDRGRTGTGAVTREDEVYLVGASTAARLGVPPEQIRPLVEGDVVRNWSLDNPTAAIWPYDPETLEAVAGRPADAIIRALWPWRTRLAGRVAYGKNQIEHGLNWFEYSMFFAERLRTPLSIAFAFVATHNHFVLDRGGKVFNRSAPVIKLPAGATEDDHFALLGLLNSSTACFWMKQVFHNKGLRGEGGGITASDWEQFFEFDSTKIRLFPIPRASPDVVPYATRLDELARARTGHSAAAIVQNPAWATAPDLRAALDARRITDLGDLQRVVALQEELDWLCYDMYDIDAETTVRSPDDVEGVPPTWLPWVLEFANRDAEVRAAIARGEDPGEIPTAWFQRHGWEPLTELPPEAPNDYRDLVQARRARIRQVPELGLIECAAYKRRWYRPDYRKEETEALAAWLADRIEVVTRERNGTATIEQITAALQDDRRVLAVAEVFTGRKDFRLADLVAHHVASDAVPSHPAHRYKPTGLAKRAEWERTWEDQRREDAGEKVTPTVPPAYAQADFLRTEYWRLRGKLDVPKERFIAFTEVPGREGDATLYGWAGWTPIERLRALLAIDADLDDAQVRIADRIGVLDSAWRLLPDAAREDAAAAARLKAELQALLGPTGPSREQVEDWQSRFPPPRHGSGRPKRRKPKGRGSPPEESTT